MLSERKVGWRPVGPKSELRGSQITWGSLGRSCVLDLRVELGKLVGCSSGKSCRGGRVWGTQVGEVGVAGEVRSARSEARPEQKAREIPREGKRSVPELGQLD